MAGFFNEMERIVQANTESALELALHYYGQTLTLMRPTKADVYSAVHAKNAGGPMMNVGEIEGILHPDDFSSSDGVNAGNFEEGYLYTKNKNVMVGDIIVIVGGSERRRFKIESKQAIGFTTDLFVKFHITNQN